MDKLLDDITVDVKYNDQHYVFVANYYRDISNLSVSYNNDVKGFQMKGIIKFTFMNTKNFKDKSKPEGFGLIELLNEKLCEFFNIKHTQLVDTHINLPINVKLEEYQILYDMSPSFCKMILKENS